MVYVRKKADINIIMRRAKDVVMASHHRVKFCRFGNLVSNTLTNDLNTLCMLKSYTRIEFRRETLPISNVRSFVLFQFRQLPACCDEIMAPSSCIAYTYPGLALL